jgi:hypothetical protein
VVAVAGRRWSPSLERRAGGRHRQGEIVNREEMVEK